MYLCYLELPQKAFQPDYRRSPAEHRYSPHIYARKAVPIHALGVNNDSTASVFRCVAFAAPRIHDTAYEKPVAPVLDPSVRSGPLLLLPLGPHPCTYIGLFRRLRIVHHWLYTVTLRRATAILDTFPYGGCLTVLEVRSSRLNPRT